MTKSKKNAVVGIHTTWSMYTDNTWGKSNRIRVISIMIAGLLTIITTAFADGMISTVFMLIYIVGNGCCYGVLKKDK